MSEKTEKPTPTKIRKARQEGQVAHSKDLTQTILILALMGYMIFDASTISQRLGAMLVLPANFLVMEFEVAISVLTRQLAYDFIALVLPPVLIVIILGLVVEMGQTGFLFALKALKPSGKKLNMVQNFKNIFGKKGLIEFLKSILKIIILSMIIYNELKSAMPNLLSLAHAPVNGVGLALVTLLQSMFMQMGLAYCVIAAADFLWQRHHYMREQMMSIDEVRREFKEQEGDPHLKNERKHLHQEILHDASIKGARSASVLITNPTHLAIALLYRSESMTLPIVLSKGEGSLASLMVLAAREAGVPVFQNVPLAHALMRLATVDQYIPGNLVLPVAEVLRMVRDAERVQQ